MCLLYCTCACKLSIVKCQWHVSSCFARVHMQLYSKEKASKLDKMFLITKIKLTLHWHECRQFTSQRASESILHALQTRILTLIKGLQPLTKRAICNLKANTKFGIPIAGVVTKCFHCRLTFLCFSLKVLLLVTKSENLRTFAPIATAHL